jgi:nitrate/nitrite transport system permease protein
MSTLINTCENVGLNWFVPFLRLMRRENPNEQFRQILLNIGVPVLAMLIFLGAWSWVASHVKVSFGSVPGPKAVWAQAGVLWNSYQAERATEAEFYVKQAARKKAYLEKYPNGHWHEHKFSGPPTYIDQIFTSLETVFAGFLIASIIAVPLGILCGLSKVFNNAMNPFIQLFKPVSPLAWLPIVMIMVSALYHPANPLFEPSFISSAVTVALCSLWPALINTALGVAAIDNDYLNVARVLKLGWWKKTTKIVIPSALPLIFTGLRLSLGVGWMVLIAAEMLAQNPGLGKFVWDMFQNGSSDTLAQIMVAVFTIGIIGFALDRVMMILQRAVSFDNAAIR